MTSLLAGALIFSDRLPILSLGGCALEILAILFIMVDERRKTSRPVFAKTKK